MPNANSQRIYWEFQSTYKDKWEWDCLYQTKLKKFQHIKLNTILMDHIFQIPKIQIQCCKDWLRITNGPYQSVLIKLLKLFHKVPVRSTTFLKRNKYSQYCRVYLQLCSGLHRSDFTLFVNIFISTQVLSRVCLVNSIYCQNCGINSQTIYH